MDFTQEDFEIIVGFEFYDGPEDGVAILKSGGGLRFTALAESKYRIFRAFLVEEIAGDWINGFRSLGIEAGVYKPCQAIILPDSSEADAFKEDIIRAASSKSYIAVGFPYFWNLKLIEVNRSIISNLMNINDNDKMFREAHNIVKLRLL